MAIIKLKANIELRHGPNLDMLLDSLKYASIKDVKIPTMFVSKHGNDYPIVVKGIIIAPTDKSNSNFNIIGNVFPYGKNNDYSTEFSAIYNTEKRNGWLEFEVGTITPNRDVSEEDLAAAEENARTFDENRAARRKTAP